MSMNPGLRAAYERELADARAARVLDDRDREFRHLERAHILSQKHPFAHTFVHAQMLVVGWRRRDPREVIGQVMRSVAALTKSKIWVPLGNTGGANVNPFKPMPVPPDLRPYLD